MNWLTGWKHRKKIIIQDAYVDGNLTNFPAYIFIDADADFHEARADGYDIRFTLSDGNTLLKYEREHWTGGNGNPATAHFWVKVPSILADGGAVIYIYYGKSDAPDGEDALNVWDANFKGIWHMKDLTFSTIADSIGVNDGTKLADNEPIEADGKIYKAQEFDALDDFIDCGNDASLALTKWTYGLWIYRKIDSILAERLISKSDAVSSDFFIHLHLANEPYTVFTDTFGAGHSLITVEAISLNEWAFVIVTFDGTYLKIYINGVLKATSGDFSAFTPRTSTRNLWIGRLLDTYRFDGYIDEVRISNIARVTTWIKFEFHNINEADNEITWGDEKSLFPIIFDVTPRKRIYDISPRARIFDRRST